MYYYSVLWFVYYFEKIKGKSVVHISEVMTVLSKVLQQIGYVICCSVVFLTEDLLSFIARLVSCKILTLTPCNKLLFFLYAMISFQQMELKTEFFPFMCILPLRVPECSCGWFI